MAPERRSFSGVMTEEQIVLSDIYSFGVLLFEMFTEIEAWDKQEDKRIDFPSSLEVCQGNLVY